MEATMAGDSPQAAALARSRSVARGPERPAMQDFWLWILLVGPLVAPLFAAIGWPVLRPFADAIYLLGQVVCPKVSVHLSFLGQPMAVCASCWAAVWGLWVVRLLHGRGGEGFGLLSRLKLAPVWARWSKAHITTKLSVLTVGFMPWALDVMLWDTGAWRSPHLFMMLVGFIGGLSAGLLLIPMAAEMRARVAEKREEMRLARLWSQ